MRPTSSFTAGEPVRARDIVLRQLAAAPRSRVELERALTRKEIDPEVARQVLDRFTEIQLVDDAGYAELVVRSQRAGRGLARQGLAHELRKRGVDPQTAGEALAAVTADDELETARSLVARRLPATARLERPVRVRRLVGMLARKGYDGGTAVRVVTEALAAEAERHEGPAPADEPAPDDGFTLEDGFVTDSRPAPASGLRRRAAGGRADVVPASGDDLVTEDGPDDDLDGVGGARRRSLSRRPRAGRDGRRTEDPAGGGPRDGLGAPSDDDGDDADDAVAAPRSRWGR